MTDSDSLQLARTALETHDWQGAYDAYVAASIDLELSGDDLQRLAEAAWWTAHPVECIDALERAYAAYSREENPRRAAYVALHLAEQCSERLQSAQAAGWFQRASRLLEGQPESVEHGYLALAMAMTSSGVEDLMEHGAAMLDIGTRFHDNDLQAFGLMVQGMAHIAKAEVPQGMLLIDEATVAAVGGELSPRATGNVYCMTIVLCRDLADYKRAGEWTEATTRWCERQAISGFPGHCRVRRAEIIRLRGAFAEAELEARHAVQELLSFGELPIAGVGFHEIGEIRLRVGDLDGAEEAFAEAHRAGERRATRVGAAATRARALGRGSRFDPCGPCRSATGVGPSTPAAGAGRDLAGLSRRRGGTGGGRGTQRDRIELRRIPLARQRPPSARGRSHARRRRACGHRRAPEGSPSLDQLRPSVRDRTGASIPRDGSSSRWG